MTTRIFSSLLALLAVGVLATAQAAQAAESAKSPAAATAAATTAKAAAAGDAKADKPAQSPQPAAKDGKKPAEEPDTIILSDTLHYNDVKKTSVFTGNVVMTRGPMTLRADKLVVHQDADGYQYGTATAKPGQLVTIRQERPEQYEVIKAKGLRAEYNGKTDEIEMIGQAVVTRYICGNEFDQISGERVKFNQKTNTYEAYAGPNSATKNGRVRSVAQPRAKTDAAVAQCREKSGKSAKTTKSKK
jgi:lipopolysaccharide export system protein LptA